MSRIAIVTPEYPGMRRPSFGGIAAQYAVMAPALAALGDEVHVIVPGAAEKPSERQGVSVYGAPVPSRTGPLFSPARCIATRRALDRLGTFDAVLAAEWSGNGALLPRGEDLPLITHLHTSLAMMIEISRWVGEAQRRGFRTGLQLWLERRQAERSRAILGCSQAIVDFAAGQWAIGNKPSAVLPNVVDAEAVRAAAAAGDAHGATGRGSPVIVSPGRLETRKGCHFLLEAMPGVWREHPEAVLVLAGAPGVLDGMPAEARLRELAGNRSEQVVITGPLPQSELFPTLAAADVVVTPSLWEAFGIVTLEAMALGKRVVATSGSGYGEFCEDGVNSILVPPQDEDALAAGILAALDPASRRMEQAAAATADAFSARRRGPEYQRRIAELAA